MIKGGDVVADVLIEAVADGNARELLGADVGGADERELAGVEGGVVDVEKIGDGQAEGGVADELEALVGGGLGAGGVSQGLFQKLPLLETIAEDILHRLHRRFHVRYLFNLIARRASGRLHLARWCLELGRFRKSKLCN